MFFLSYLHIYYNAIVFYIYMFILFTQNEAIFLQLLEYC